MRNVARIVAALAMAVVLAAMCCAPHAFAAKASGSNTYVLDKSQDVSDKSSIAQMEKNAAQMSSEYGVGVYLLYTECNEESGDRTSAKAKWDEYNMGLGSDESGILLYIATQDRRMVTITHGKGVDAFEDSRIDQMEEAEAEHLSSDDWIAAGEEYLELAQETLAYYEQHGTSMAATDGRNVDYGNGNHSNSSSSGQTDLRTAGIVGLVVGAIVAFFTRRFLKGQLKSVYSGSDADRYTNGHINITDSNDRFMGTTVSRIRKPQIDTSGGGGGGFDSGGFGGSGGRGF